MKNYCASCGDALFYSEGTRLNPLNYFSACRYLSDNEETDKMYLDENERYSLASDLAADICSMCCDKHIDLLMAFDHDEDNEETYQLIADVVEEKCTHEDVTEEEKRFIAEFYKYGFVGLMLDWIDRGMKDDYKIIVKLMGITLRGNITNSIRNFENSNKGN